MYCCSIAIVSGVRFQMQIRNEFKILSNYSKVPFQVFRLWEQEKKTETTIATTSAI